MGSTVRSPRCAHAIMPSIEGTCHVPVGRGDFGSPFPPEQRGLPLLGRPLPPLLFPHTLSFECHPSQPSLSHTKNDHAQRSKGKARTRSFFTINVRA